MDDELPTPHSCALSPDTILRVVDVFIFFCLFSYFRPSFLVHHLPTYLHSINAGVFWMSPVALHQKLDILKGSGKIILQRKRVRGKKEMGV